MIHLEPYEQEVTNAFNLDWGKLNILKKEELVRYANDFQVYLKIRLAKQAERYTQTLEKKNIEIDRLNKENKKLQRMYQKIKTATRKESPGRPVLYDDSVRENINKMHENGKSIRKIASELIMSPSTVQKLLHV